MTSLAVPGAQPGDVPATTETAEETAAAPKPPRKPPAGTAADVRSVLIALGGVATHAELVSAVSERALRTALVKGGVVRLRRNIYALPAVAPATPSRGATADERAAARAERVALARRTATSLDGAMSHRSAAEYYELPLLVDAGAPEILLPRGSRVDVGTTRLAAVRHRELARAELRERVTDPMRTVLDCAADLPAIEGLAVLDSALRGDDDHPALVARSQLVDAADRVGRSSRTRVQRLVSWADGGAANPSESALRWIALQIPGLVLHTQVEITCQQTYRVDIADRRRRIVMEFDSAQWHNTPDAFVADCRRYNDLVAHGWIVLRFTWDDVMFHAERVRAQIEAVARLTDAARRR